MCVVSAEYGDLFGNMLHALWSKLLFDYVQYGCQLFYVIAMVTILCFFLEYCLFLNIYFQ